MRTLIALAVAGAFTAAAHAAEPNNEDQQAEDAGRRIALELFELVDGAAIAQHRITTCALRDLYTSHAFAVLELASAANAVGMKDPTVDAAVERRLKLVYAHDGEQCRPGYREKALEWLAKAPYRIRRLSLAVEQ